MIDFWLCDLQGRTLEDFTDLAGGVQGTVTIALNAGRSASVPASFDDAAAALVRPLQTVVKASWDRGHLFSGVATRPQYSGRARSVTIPARDPLFKLAASQIGARSDGAPFAVQTQVDQSEILARLMEHASPAAAEIAAGVPGHGLIRGSLPVSVQRDRAYEPGKGIAEAMRELTGVIDGVDMDIHPVDQTDGTLAVLDSHYPFMGTDRSDRVIFEYGWGLENVVDCSVEPAGDLVKNRSIRVGHLDETTQTQPSASADRAESLIAHGIYSEYVGESDVYDAVTLAEHASGMVTAYGFAPFFITLTPAQDDGSGYQINPATGALEVLPKRFGSAPVIGGDYWLGDVCSVVLRDGPAFDFDLQARVVQITLANAVNGATVAELTLAPLLGGGYRLPGTLPPSFAREFRDMRDRLRLSGIVQ